MFMRVYWDDGYLTEKAYKRSQIRNSMSGSEIGEAVANGQIEHLRTIPYDVVAYDSQENVLFGAKFYAVSDVDLEDGVISLCYQEGFQHKLTTFYYENILSGRKHTYRYKSS